MMSARTAPIGVSTPNVASPLRSAGFLLPLSIILFGASWPIVKMALSTAGATPVWLAASRSGLACFALVVVLALRGSLSLPSRADLPTLLAVGVLQLTSFFVLCHYAIQHVPAGHTAVLSNSALLWIVPLAALMGWREHPLRWLAAGLTLAGIAVLVIPWPVQPVRSGALLGYALLLTAALAWACTIMVTRLWPASTSPLVLLPWAFALSFMLLLALAVSTERTGGVPVAAWPYAALNGLVIAPFGTYCLVELSRRLTPTVSSILFMAIPVAGVFASAVVLGERVGVELALGSILIVVGMGVAATKGSPDRRDTDERLT